jgi:hypothetical protein
VSDQETRASAPLLIFQSFNQNHSFNR